MFNEKEKKFEIEKLISHLFRKKLEDKYILDENNAIVVINSDNGGYIMIHERLISGKLVVINRWLINRYYFGSIHDITTIKDLNLFQIQNGVGEFNALYDYKEGKFVVPQGIWRAIDAGRNNNFLQKYNGFLASFNIGSDYEEGDVYSFISPITGEKIVESFGCRTDNYYAILNVDGTIRENKLFLGTSLSKITEIIDLNLYGSLNEFKEEVKKFCNEQKQKQKQEYYKLLESRNDGSISPYLDSEVVKTLNLKNK